MPIPIKLIQKAQKLLSLETGTVHKTAGGRLSLVLAFPNTYRLGMSSLGFQLVYGMLNSDPEVVCERVFLPESSDLNLLVRSGSRLFSLESQTSVEQFDALGFSISFELDYLNVLRVLSLSGLPLLAAERDESHPLVIAGGPCATFNPEPVADFVDLFVVGEAEDVMPELVAVLKKLHDTPRTDLLREIAQIDGVYVPRFYTPTYGDDGRLLGVDVSGGVPKTVKRRRTAFLDEQNAASTIQTPETEFGMMRLIEVIRGCRRQCRFCVAGYTDLPPRPRKVNVPQDAKRIGLVGSSVFDHPDALLICEDITGQGREFSVSSTRIESLTGPLAKLMHGAGQETITLAPEAGTERLRRTINKDILDPEVFEAVETAASAGFRRVKLYFMVGLPTETDEDVEAIGHLARSIARNFRSLSIQLSVSCFVPKPWTPFQWVAMATERELSAKLAVVRKSVAGDRQIKLNSESPRLSVVQGWLARGDRRLSAALIAALQEDSYSRGIAQAGLDPAFYAQRLRDRDEVLPWDHIDMGVKKDYLWREYQNALQGKPSLPCNTPECKRCGVC